MEEELCKLREESDASKGLFKQRTEKLTKRLELMNSRYEALDKRRTLEVEGYKSDIKLLRQRLKEVENQLYKVLLCWRQLHSILYDVHFVVDCQFQRWPGCSDFEPGKEICCKIKEAHGQLTKHEIQNVLLRRGYEKYL